VASDNASIPAIPGWEIACRGNALVLFYDWVDPRPDATRQ
jgi:hypothetical protein